MAVEVVIGKKVVVVGIKMDRQSRELLDWALVKVADPGDRVVAVHVRRNSECTPKDKPLLDSYLGVYEGLCNVRKVELSGQVLMGNSIWKVLVREAKGRAAVAVVVGISIESPFGTRAKVAKYCTKHLPPSTSVLAVHNGKVVFGRSSSRYQPPGLKGDPRPSFFLVHNPATNDKQSKFGGSKISELTRPSYNVIPISKDGPKDGYRDSKNENINLVLKHPQSSSIAFSILLDDLNQTPGWPLLRVSIPVISPEAQEARQMSVVKWVMSLPNRYPLEPEAVFNSIQTKFSSMGESSNYVDEGYMSLSKYSELLDNLEKLLQRKSTCCKWFSYDVIKASTYLFSSDRLIGEGGHNRVYKGFLPRGKPVAVKVSKSCKEAWNNFSLEVDITTSLKHRNVTPLLGICVEDRNLISVYDFLSRGSLEEYLHAGKKEKALLSWDVRLKLAIGIAEALNYIHECSPPVIHRDVKSSNILLSNDFEPQLSDFGLAVWGPTASSFLTYNDVVGTFGYLAPEYFMYGRVSDKIDVYSYGVVLLELLSGRKPISSVASKGLESLVIWAKPKLEDGDLKSILDPVLNGDVDDVRVQRLALAAKLCLTRSARLRPKMKQVLKILKGEKDTDELVNSESGDPGNNENQENADEEVYPRSSPESHVGLALLDLDDNCTSFGSIEQSRIFLEEYLEGRWSRCSNLDSRSSL
ncbi:Non-specific serine/threonine protein kinase [Bertholletia excelsa]